MMLALALLAPPPATESIGLVGTSQGVPVKGILTRTVQADRSLLSTLELTLMPPGQDPIIVRQETRWNLSEAGAHGLSWRLSVPV